MAQAAMTHAWKWTAVITMCIEGEGTGNDLRLSLRTLPAPDVALMVRALLDLRLPLWKVADVMADDIRLVATELVANACAATPSMEIIFQARLERGTVWVGVWDSGSGMPRPRMRELSLADIDGAADDRFGGWGLSLVAAVAAEHGVRRTPGGKWVFASFRVSGARRPAARGRVR